MGEGTGEGLGDDDTGLGESAGPLPKGYKATSVNPAGQHSYVVPGLSPTALIVPLEPFSLYSWISSSTPL